MTYSISTAKKIKRKNSIAKKSSYLSEGSEWTFDLIETYNLEISYLAEQCKLDTYPNQIEIINSEQMLDAYSASGMPLMYNHWSFGKQFLAQKANYEKGYMGLAYEIVINSNPCIAYLMAENNMTMQALVIAHACYGHNSFFKGNYLFKEWTNADAIIDYLLFAKNYIAQCEERYGIDAVEEVLDACHALQAHAVNRYNRPEPLSSEQEACRFHEREAYIQKTLNDIWNTIPKKENKVVMPNPKFPVDPEENILYFIEKNAPALSIWKRELIRIVRKISQYFYPQKQTKVMNEGWATFWHYTLMNELYNNHKITESAMLYFFTIHTNVVHQPEYDSAIYQGMNPYALGFNIFKDLRRICENPTQEDKQWFPDIAASNWLTTLDYAMRHFNDESFIQQFLSPKVIRDMHLFVLTGDRQKPYYEINAIHNEIGYRTVRNVLANQHNLGNLEPNIQVYSVDMMGDRTLMLRHYMHCNRDLDTEDTARVLAHLKTLWSFDVALESVTPDNKIQKTYTTKTSV
ncbi:MAG: SpoVR family protein [Endozoicomonadaceae bacterium]|nr:SpoVR family protein [Endozoicomonadaceae bacterium]